MHKCDCQKLFSKYLKKKKNSSTQRLVLFLEIKFRVTASLTLHLLKIHKFRKFHKFRSNQKQLDKSGIEPETFYLRSKRDNPYTTCPKDCYKCTLNVFVRFSGFLTKILFFFLTSFNLNNAEVFIAFKAKSG